MSFFNRWNRDFHKAMEFTFKWEGGYVNDPDDPGGETNFGISKRAHPEVDITNLTQTAAKKIYYKEYWKAASCDKLPSPENIALFDMAVNIGVSRSIKLIADTARQNGRLDLEWQDVILIRIKYYVNLVASRKDLRKYLRGWLNRVVDLEKYCRKLT